MAKFLIVMVGFAGALWIPNSFFKGYMEFSRYVSIVFLLVQAMLMLIVAYKLNETLVKNYENESSGGTIGCNGVIIIFLFLLFTAGNVTWTVF